MNSYDKLVQKQRAEISHRRNSIAQLVICKGHIENAIERRIKELKKLEKDVL